VNLSGFHLPFNFHLLSTPWNAQAISQLIEIYEAALPRGAWPNWVLGNHDRSRVASRLGPTQARIAAMLLLTLRGTPTLYQGDEIGMTDVPIPPERVRDPWERNVPGLGLGRDPVRTPMQWDASANAGFTTTAEPWLPVGPAYQTVNVEEQASDPRSILSLYRALVTLRRAEPALSVGTYRTFAAEGNVLAYVRQDERTGRRMLVALNLGRQPQAVPLTDFPPGRVRVSTGCDRAEEGVESILRLGPDEGVVVDVATA
jgi:alpha-glucosidase